MKRTVTAIILVIALAICLAACDSGSAESVIAATASDDTAVAEIPEIPLAKGETTVDVGDFTVTVPEGWLGAGDLDMDEENNYIIGTYYYLLIKGGESAEEQFIKPTVSIYYTSENSAQELLDINITPEDENTELDVTVGGKKCLAYHAVKSYTDEDEGPFVMEYDYVFIPVTDSSCLRLTMLTYSTNAGETGISASDADVIAIMESLKVN
jgi:hypothetical protein